MIAGTVGDGDRNLQEQLWMQ